MNSLLKSSARMLACVALAMGAAAAQADTYNFVLTGNYGASWQLSSSPSPDAAGSSYFGFDQISGNVPDAGAQGAFVYFYTTSRGGGLTLGGSGADSGLNIPLAGPQLFTGSTSAPTFILGTFTLTKSINEGGTYTLSVTNLSAVPEPATMALLLGGLGLVGAAARRRKG